MSQIVYCHFHDRRTRFCKINSSFRLCYRQKVNIYCSVLHFLLSPLLHSFLVRMNVRCNENKPRRVQTSPGLSSLLSIAHTSVTVTALFVCYVLYRQNRPLRTILSQYILISAVDYKNKYAHICALHIYLPMKRTGLCIIQRH
jgi:hypothetical protein